jgi:hypothetical protein
VTVSRLLSPARLAVLVWVASTLACAETSVTNAPPAPSAPEPAIAAVHRARCGACHVRVEPGTRTRDALTVALGRHRTRVHLSDAQWAALIEYLAPG